MHRLKVDISASDLIDMLQQHGTIVVARHPCQWDIGWNTRNDYDAHQEEYDSSLVGPGEVPTVQPLKKADGTPYDLSLATHLSLATEPADEVWE